MAAQAVEQLEPYTEELQLVPPLEAGYQFVDEIPEVYAARQVLREEAATILADRREHYTETGERQAPVDPLSTAHKVLAEERPAERETLYQGLVLDCQRLVAEWYRKKKPEYFPVARHIFDETTEEFFSHGLSVRQMTENALIPIQGDQEEEGRRVNEYVEDATPQLLRSLGTIAIGSEAIRTISECSDTAIAAYEIDQKYGRPHQGYSGYVPEIKKLMIRDIRLSDETEDRFEEQLGLPGIYITHEIVQMALERTGVQADHLDKTELHGSQLLVADDLMDFARILDEVASEQWCTTIFMGEEVAPGTVKDYAGFREEALTRQAKLVDIAETVAQFVLHLAEDNADRAEALQLVEAFVKHELLDLAKQDLSVAEQMFDEKTAHGLEAVYQLEQAGRDEEARLLMDLVAAEAPGGGFCGAGSCGIAEFDLRGAEADALKKELGFRSGDKLAKDTVRACTNCGKKELYYAYSNAKVNTVCQGCHASKKSVGMVSRASQQAAA